VVIPRGSLGEGEVTQAEPAGSNGHPDKLKLQFDWIYPAEPRAIAAMLLSVDQRPVPAAREMSMATIAIAAPPAIPASMPSSTLTSL
jgi:hypothetical protein